MVGGEAAPGQESAIRRISWSALAELLVRYHDIHEGWWTAAIESNGSMSVVMEMSGAAFPAIGLPITQIGIRRVQDGARRDANAVNAAVVNPKRSIVLASQMPINGRN